MSTPIESLLELLDKMVDRVGQLAEEGSATRSEIAGLKAALLELRALLDARTQHLERLAAAAEAQARLAEQDAADRRESRRASWATARQVIVPAATGLATGLVAWALAWLHALPGVGP